MTVGDGRPGLRARLVLVFAAVTVLVAGGTAAAVAVTVRSWIYSTAEASARTQFRTELAASENRRTVNLRDDSSVRSALPWDVTAIIGDRVVATGVAPPEQISASFRQRVTDHLTVVSQAQGTHRVLVGTIVRLEAVETPAPHPPGSGPGTATPGAGNTTVEVKVFALRPLLGVRDKITTMVTVVGVSLAVGILLSALLGAWVAGLLVRPLNRLDRAAARAAEGDLSVHLPETGLRELARVTSTFNHMVRQHHSSLERSRRFVADVSHELRTPLAALVPMSEVLQDERGHMSADARTAADILDLEIGRLSRLVEDLMEMSRHDAGRAVLDRAVTDLVALARTTLSSRGWADHVRLLTPQRLLAGVDARRVEVVLANLVGNALRHGAPPVEVELVDGPECVVISVTDHGPGIPSDHLDTVFQRFVKVDTARGRSEGSGLGLSLVLENVRLHGGTVEVASVPGRTVFTVRLPRA